MIFCVVCDLCGFSGVEKLKAVHWFVLSAMPPQLSWKLCPAPPYIIDHRILEAQRSTKKMPHTTLMTLRLHSLTTPARDLDLTAILVLCV